MKILFVGVNQRYITKTNSLLPGVLQKISEVFFYGPGFLDSKVLDKGISSYIESIGDVDFIFVTAQCIIDIDFKRLDNYFRRYTAVLNDGCVTQKFLDDVKFYCGRNKEKVICSILEVDPHVTPQSTIDSLDEYAQYLFGWGNGFLNAKMDMNAVDREEYIQKKLRTGHVLGLLDSYVNNNPSRIINLGHFVSDAEFYWGNMSSRKFDVAVPGSQYDRRLQALSALKRVKQIRIASNRYKYFFKISDRLLLNPYSNFYAVSLYNLFFQQELSRSKTCICDGGGINYPVRKFFEIPASGALLTCWPALGLDSLGFVNGENCIFIEDTDGLIRVVNLLLGDQEYLQSMAIEGRTLVMKKHSLSARAEQLRDALFRIECGNYNGSIWDAGEFRLID